MSSYTYSRTRLEDGPILDIGPYEAIVINHLDPLSMGSLEVELLRRRGATGTPERSGQLVMVKYLSPFYGVTPVKGLKQNDGYQFTQKSYGFWAVPPDPGTRVLVIFAEGHAAYGYWIGCIQDHGMNFMVPDGRASTVNTTDITPSNLKGAKLPVGEYNKLLETANLIDPTLFSKPYNKDFTETLEVQGLLYDEARGTTTSSARRETPSMVFGWSSPGPLDKRQTHPTTKYGDDRAPADVPFNRLGGSSIVMDDGDDKFIRATHAEDGPPIYINKEVGEPGGDETIPQNELFRIRTRTGHQILLHNSEDIIYISNSRGTAWIELTSDGKIDIHAQDSISIMTDTDLNITAERDINLEAGRNVNIKASARWSDGKQFEQGKESGRVQIESLFNTNIDVGKDYKITVGSSADVLVRKEMKTTVENNYFLHSKANIFQRSDSATHESSGHSFYRTSESNLHDKVKGVSFLDVGGDINIISRDANIKAKAAIDINTLSGEKTKFTSTASMNIRSTGANVYVTGSSDIHLNGPAAAIASPASLATQSSLPEDATPVITLATYTLPYIIPGSLTPVQYDSILLRAPQHEPWPHHENLAPLNFKRQETDRENPGDLTTADRILTPDTFLKNKGELARSTRVTGSGGNIVSGGGGGDAGDFHGQGYTENESTGEPAGQSRYKDGLEYNADYTSKLPPNVQSDDPELPRQYILDAMQKAVVEALGPTYKVRITPEGGRGTRKEGTQNHPGGYAADFYILDPQNQRITPPYGQELYIRLVERLLINANAKGVRPGIGGYNWGIHYDETPSRQPRPPIVNRGDAGTWSNYSSSYNAPIATAIQNVRKGLA